MSEKKYIKDQNKEMFTEEMCQWCEKNPAFRDWGICYDCGKDNK